MSLLILALLLAAPPAAPQGPPSSVEGMEPAPGVPSLLQSGVPALPPELRSRTGQYLNARAASLADVSEDGGTLLITTRFASTAQLHVVEMPLGMRTQVTFGDEPVNQARFQPGDPQTIWYLQDSGGGEFYQLYQLDVQGKQTPLAAEVKWDVEELAVSEDGSRVAFAANEDGASRLYLLDRQHHAQQIALPGIPVISNFEFPRHRADQLAVTFQTATQPADVYQIDLRGMRVVRWTRSEGGGPDPGSFVDAQLVRYPAGGGAATIPAFL